MGTTLLTWVSDLIGIYSDIVDYEDGLEDYVREYSPDEYKKLLHDRDNAIKKKTARSAMN